MPMERPLRFDYRDVLWSPAIALSLRKITVMTFFLCLGLAFYSALTYLALAVGGENLGAVWRLHGLLPPLALVPAATAARVVMAIGLLAAGLCLMMGLFAVSASAIEEVRGNRFLNARQMVHFAFRRLPQMLLAELAIALLIGLTVLLFVVIGLVSRIPWVGDWLYTILFALPGFLVALLIVFVIMVFTVTVILLPAVAAGERYGETFAAILETFSTILRQPFRWLAYTALGLFTARLCGFVYAYFCFRAVQFATGAAGLVSRDPERLVRAGLAHLPADSELVRYTFNVFPGLDWSFSIAPWLGGYVSAGAAGYLMAAVIFVIFASIYGYMMATVAVSQARAYVVIRYLKDGYDMTGEKSLFFEDEPVNPPIEEEGEGTREGTGS